MIADLMKMWWVPYLALAILGSMCGYVTYGLSYKRELRTPFEAIEFRLRRLESKKRGATMVLKVASFVVLGALVGQFFSWWTDAQVFYVASWVVLTLSTAVMCAGCGVYVAVNEFEFMIIHTLRAEKKAAK